MPPRRPPSPPAAPRPGDAPRPATPPSGTPVGRQPARPAAGQPPAKQPPAKQPPARQPSARQPSSRQSSSRPAAARQPSGRSAPGRGAKPAAKPIAPKPKPTAKRGASRAPASRPATSNRPRAGAGGRSAGPGSGVRTGLGRPLWVLAAVAVVLALLVLPYVQKWMVQQREIAAVRADNAKARQQVGALETERNRWQDPEYVKAEARRRLFYVMPGETGFVVVDSQPPQKAAADPAHAAAAQVKNGDRPWFGDLWDSLRVAGETPPDDGR